MPQANPFDSRMKWWYESISDLLIAHPNLSQSEIATRLGRHVNTVHLVIKSDAFKDFHGKRREEFRRRLDDHILGKTAEIAALGLDLIHESLKKKRDQVALPVLLETTGDALDRLGFGTKNPAVQINNIQQNNDQRVVALPGLTQHELLEAQAALRLAEARRLDAKKTPLLEAEVVDDPSLAAE